jgi:small subunit ribosomal protein S20
VPNIKAAEKWVRQSLKRTQRNLDVKTRLKTVFKKAAASPEAGAIQSVEAQYDKAAQKGIIHPNKAARKKSRLAKGAAKTEASPAPAAKKAPAKAASPKKKAKK